MKIKFFVLLWPFGLVNAQESIQTDRPDQTESTSITPKGHLQIETGFFYERTGKESKSFSHPTVLWKYGIHENFEARIGTEFISEIAYSDKKSGIPPLTFGFKVKLADEKVFFPKISFLGHLTANRLASSNYKTPHPAPSFRFLFQHTLSDQLSLGYNLGAEWNGENPDITGIYTVSTSYSFNERFGSFAEFYGFINEFQPPDHRFDTGFTYLFSNNFQVDASAGIGISHLSPRYFLSCGASYRFRLK